MCVGGANRESLGILEAVAVAAGTPGAGAPVWGLLPAGSLLDPDPGLA